MSTYTANVTSTDRTGEELAALFAGADEYRIDTITDHGVTVALVDAPDEYHAEQWLMDALPDDGDDITVDDWQEAAR